MNARLIVLTLTLLPLFGQQPLPNPVTGAVQRVSGNEIQVLVHGQPVALFTDEKTIVWKGNESHAAIRDGDEIRARYTRGFWGKLIASEIQCRVDFSGVVIAASAGTGAFEVAAASGATRKIYLSPKTEFGVGGRRLNDGDHVLVVGWDLGYGRMEAVRIAIYDTDAPLESRK
jgi:hypothetical protein